MDIREEIALAALGGMYSVTEIALRYGVTRPTVRVWRERYREHGQAGLKDRSHATRNCPHKLSAELEELIVAERERFGWGSKKILRRLQDAHPGLELPSRSAIDAVLQRRGLVNKQRRPRSRGESPFRHRYTPSAPAELMTIDHKGQFRMGNGKYCYALTIADNVSRYLLACEALGSSSLEEAWPVIVRVFREHGLPTAMHSDNGPPFGSPSGGLSTMSVRLMKLNVLPVFSRPGSPQDNGKHERMHLDLKAETTRPPAFDAAGQQAKFDQFRHRYNVERPHEALEMRRPANVFVASSRPYPRRPHAPEYPGHFEVRKVSDSGAIKLEGRSIFVGHALAGEQVGLQATGEQLYSVHFHAFAIGKVDMASNKFI